MLNSWTTFNNFRLDEIIVKWLRHFLYFYKN
jgi:hypothetical protein